MVVSVNTTKKSLGPNFNYEKINFLYYTPKFCIKKLLKKLNCKSKGILRCLPGLFGQDVYQILPPVVSFLLASSFFLQYPIAAGAIDAATFAVVAQLIALRFQGFAKCYKKFKNEILVVK